MVSRLSAIQEQDYEESLLLPDNGINASNKNQLKGMLDEMEAHEPAFGSNDQLLVPDQELSKAKSDGFALLAQASKDYKSQVVVSKSGRVFTHKSGSSEEKKAKDDFGLDEMFGQIRESSGSLTKDQAQAAQIIQGNDLMTKYVKSEVRARPVMAARVTKMMQI
jgi:hypothetical protein